MILKQIENCPAHEKSPACLTFARRRAILPLELETSKADRPRKLALTFDPGSKAYVQAGKPAKGFGLDFCGFLPPGRQVSRKYLLARFLEPPAKEVFMAHPYDIFDVEDHIINLDTLTRIAVALCDDDDAVRLLSTLVRCELLQLKEAFYNDHASKTQKGVGDDWLV